MEVFVFVCNKKYSNKNSILESDSNVEDVEFVEKYLNQQFKGQKPESDGKKVAYLTFDNDPSETVTPSILNTLKIENVQATT
jgi:peptidoglycan-N-acetylglucosamine deacetylase